MLGRVPESTDKAAQRRRCAPSLLAVRPPEDLSTESAHFQIREGTQLSRKPLTQEIQHVCMNPHIVTQLYVK